VFWWINLIFILKFALFALLLHIRESREYVLKGNSSFDVVPGNKHKPATTVTGFFVSFFVRRSQTIVFVLAAEIFHKFSLL
jgi:hypothetical protein